MGPWKTVGGQAAAGRDHDVPVWVGHDASERFPIYTRGNAGEVYPEVFTPLSFSVASEATERAMRNALIGSGLVRRSELDGIPITTGVGSGVFGGYAYLNLSIQRLISARALGGKATDADVNLLGVGEPPPHEPLPEERNLVATLAGVRSLWRTVRRHELPELAEDQRRVDHYLGLLGDPTSSSDEELRRSIELLMPLFADLFERHLEVSFAAGLVVAVLSSLCERQLDDPTLAVGLLAGLGDVDSAAPSKALWDLGRLANGSQRVTELFDDGVEGLTERLHEASGDDPDCKLFVDRFAAFVQRFGSRGPNEWDTAFDTWETAPALALNLVDRMRAADESHDPSRQQQRLTQEAAELEAAASARLAWPVRPLFRRVLAAARLYSRGRERSKTTVIRAIHGARLQSMELDRRLVERSGGQQGDLWFLLEDELDGYLADPASYRSIIAERRATHRALAERVPPFFFAGSQPPLEEWELRTATRAKLRPGDTITGLPGCPGIARGTARVVTDPGDPRGLRPGDVLVAPLTDPAWTPLFVPAEAVVVDVGAIMSHAVIVSRELGIPCVVSATEATKRIADGAIIEVDGGRGTVTVVG
ncbi:MAG: PEP-utilizing enzyme [Acidimicrobiales bacterium]